MAQSDKISFEISLKSIFILLVVVLLVILGVFYSPKLINKFKSKQRMLVYTNEEYGVSFKYPDYLVLEDESSSDNSLLIIRFTGEECSSEKDVLKRPHIPYLYFNIQKKDIGAPETADPCSSRSPNCRASTNIGPFKLENGLEAEIFELFGTSSDGIFLSVKEKGLNYVFSTSEAPVACGEKYDYIPEVFQVANSLRINH